MPTVPEQALEWLEKAKGHQVTVVGEDIVDEYIHVRPAGKSAKDNLVTFISDGREIWPGGARVIHRHLEALGCESKLCTSVRPIIKTRFIDTAFKQKVFSVTNTDDVSGMEKCPVWSSHLLLADFGHSRALLPIDGAFKTVMVQSNSLNWGFNLLTKHQHADYVVCDETELRLACCNQWDHATDLIPGLATRMEVKYLAVTLGHRGALLYEPATRQYRTFPVYARQVVDRMGAGDAFLAASAPLAAMGAPAEVVGLVGSVAAGLHVEKEGNPPLCREELIQRLKELT